MRVPGRAGSVAASEQKGKRPIRVTGGRQAQRVSAGSSPTVHGPPVPDGKPTGPAPSSRPFADTDLVPGGCGPLRSALPGKGARATSLPAALAGYRRGKPGRLVAPKRRNSRLFSHCERCASGAIRCFGRARIWVRCRNVRAPFTINAGRGVDAAARFSLGWPCSGPAADGSGSTYSTCQAGVRARLPLRARRPRLGPGPQRRRRA